MADIESNIRIDIDATSAVAAIQNLQRQISAFHKDLRASGNSVNKAVSDNLAKNLTNAINSTKQFSASIQTVRNETVAFTSALEKNKLSFGQYFRYGAAASGKFTKTFSKEFNAISKIAEERVKTLQTQYIALGKNANGAIESIKVRPLALDMKNLSTQVAISAQKQQIFNQIVKQGTTNLLNFGKNTQWAGRQLMVGFTIPLSMLGTTAAKSFMDIEKAVIKFKRVYGDMGTTAAQTDAMAESIQNLAKEYTKYGVAVADTMDMAAEAAAMGKMGAELTAQVAEATRLAVLGGVEQAQALETTTSLTNAFGIAAEDLAGKINFLNAVENQTVTSIEDLTIAIPKAAPVIQQLGGNVEDLAYFLTAMKEGGINASEGANALKSGLASMINPTKKASDFLKSFGIDIAGIVSNNAGDVKNMVIGLASALDQLDPLNRAQAIEQLFGKFQFARISTLFKNVISEGSQASKVLDMTRSSAQELAILSERELKRVEDSPMFKFQKALEDIKTSLAPIGEEFLKLVTPLIEFGTKLLKQFNGLDDGVKKFVMGTVAVLGLIAPAAIMAFGLVANGIANFLKGLNFVRLMFGKLAGAGTGLNQMTSYMTQEHLEATAVSRSLAEAHGNLAATFGVEKTALDQLTQSYTHAVAEMQKYNVAAQARVRPGSQTKTKKYAKGVATVPGPRGAGDIVPAMLAPGEAVIPAEEATKYAPLIQGIIANNIPGFKYGLLSDPGTDRRAPLKVSYDIANKNVPGSGDQVLRELEAAGIKITEARKIMRGIADLSIEGSESVKAAITNLKNGIESGLRGAKLTSDFRNKTGTGKPTGSGVAFAHVGDGATMTREEILAAAQSGELKVAPGKLRNISGMAAGSAIPVKSGLGMGGINQKVNAQLAAKGATMADFAATYDEAGVEKWNQSIEFAGGNVKELSGDVELLDNEMKRLIKASKAAKIFDTEKQRKEYEAQTGNKAESVQRLFGQARKKVAGTKLDATLTDAAATVTEIRDTGTSPGAKSRRSMGKSAALRKAHAKEMEELGASDARAYKRGADKEIAKDKQSDMYPKSRQRKSPHKQASQDGIDDAKAYGEASRNQAGKERKKSLTEEQRAQKQLNAQKRARNAGRVAGALGTATMVIGMASMSEGPVGEMAQQIMPFASGLSMVAPLLMAMPAPLALFVGGIAAGALAIYQWNKNIDDSAKKGRELASSMSMTADKLSEISKVAGTVTATELANSKRAQQLTGEDQKKVRFGQTFLDSDVGKSMLSDAESVLKTSGASAMASNLANQLSYSIVQGALSPEQARSIAIGIGEQLNNYSLGMSIAGQITALVGPNGEDLVKDPLKISLEVQQNSTEAQTTAYDNALAEIEKNAALDGGTVGNMIGGGIMTGIGAVMTATGVLAPLGLGLIAGGIATTVAAGVNEGFADAADNIEASSVAVQLGAEQIAQNQGLLDSLSRQYDVRVEDLNLKLKSAKTDEDKKAIEDEITKTIQDRNTALETQKAKNAEIFNTLIAQAKQLGPAFNDAVGKSIDEKFKDASGGLKAAVDLAKTSLAEMEDSDFKATLQLGLASGEFDPITVTNLVNAAATNKDLEVKFDAVVGMVGTADANQLLQLLGASGVKTDQYSVFLDFMVNDQEQFAANMEALSQFASMQTEYGIKVKVTEDGLDEVGNFINQTEKLKEEDTITVDVVRNFIEQNSGNLDSATLSGLQGMINNWDVLTNGTNKVNYQVMVDFVIGKANDAAIAAWYQENFPEEFAKMTKYKRRGYGSSNLDTMRAAFFSQGNTQPEPKVTTGTKTGSGSGSAKSNPWEALLTRLKRIRDAAINANMSLKDLKDTLEGGAISKGLFKGTDQQLLKAGYSTEFIDQMMALDEDQRKTFITITNGRVKVTEAGKLYQKALAEAALGDKQFSIMEQVSNIGYQLTAMEKLEAQGMSTADAMNIAADANLAYAISTAANAEEIDNLIEWMDKLKNKQFELDSSTTAGREKIVTSATSQVNEWFAAKEAQINADFEQGTNASGKNTSGYNIGALNDTIQEAQNSISDYQSNIDDLQYVLDGIADKEDTINEKYDKRKAALEKVWDLNKEISAQQKGQLDIANALSSGDIAAAARAVQAEQERKTQQAQDAAMSRLEAARESDLGKLTGTNGKTRLEIEKEIKRLSGEIAAIEETKLEPAQRNLDLATQARDRANETLTYLGQTKTAWDNVASAARLATVDSLEFSKSIRDTLSALPGFVELFDKDNNFAGYKFDPAAYLAWLKDGTGSGSGEDGSGGNDNERKTTTTTTAKGKTTTTTKKKTTTTAKKTTTAKPKPTSASGGGGGGGVKYRAAAAGGLIPQYLAAGGTAKAVRRNLFKAIGTDTVPAMLTPGEFVMSKYAVQQYGVDRLKAINNGASVGDSVYNYSVNVNVQSDADANEIARAVMTQIKQVDAKRIKGYGF